jgi:hypothetical protein
MFRDFVDFRSTVYPDTALHRQWPFIVSVSADRRGAFCSRIARVVKHLTKELAEFSPSAVIMPVVKGGVWTNIGIPHIPKILLLPSRLANGFKRTRY